MIHDVLAVFDMFMVIGSVIGLVVLAFGVLDGVFMVYDRVRYGKRILDA